MANQPEFGAKLIIRNREECFFNNYARVKRRYELVCIIDMDKEKLPDGDVGGKRYVD